MPFVEHASAAVSKQSTMLKHKQTNHCHKSIARLMALKLSQQFYNDNTFGDYHKWHAPLIVQDEK